MSDCPMGRSLGDVPWDTPERPERLGRMGRLGRAGQLTGGSQ
jgi:hypothetical protein